MLTCCCSGTQQIFCTLVSQITLKHIKTITINVLYKLMYNTDNYRFKLCCHLLAIYHVLPPDSSVTYFRWERQWTMDIVNLKIISEQNLKTNQKAQ